jgi:outer membrane protein assembly factor BamB
MVSSPAVARGLIYFSSYEGWFYAVDTLTKKLK